MELAKIKKLNQNIYQLDTEITRNNKMMFIATLIFCTLNKDFRNPNKTTSVINFIASNNPIDDLLDLAKSELSKKNIIHKTLDSVKASLNIIHGVNTKLYKDRTNFQKFVLDFVTDYIPFLQEDENLFLETLYMEVDKKAKNSDKGITLTPKFAAQLMVDLSELDYKNDVVADLGSGTGLFSLLSYSTMLNNIEKDKKESKLTDDDYRKYKARLLDSIIANDFEPKMVTLCLANFILKDLNTMLILNEDVFDINKSSFELEDQIGKKYNLNPTKGILNPPYEDTYRPIEIIRKTIELIKDNNNKKEKVVVIVPPQKFGQKKEEFNKILNLARLESVIKMQDDLFADSGQSPSTCVFVFNLERAHKKEDVIHYYNFNDSGYVYLKDSGMVDKYNTHDIRKEELLKKISKSTNSIKKPTFLRNWTNFYEVNQEMEIDTVIDPDKIKISKEEADITLENITIKKMLDEKEGLINSVQNTFKDDNNLLKNYIIDILSEEIK